MSTKKPQTNQTEQIKVLKEQFLEYYAKLPIQKYAGHHVGRNEDTIGRWIKEDKDFADRVAKAKSDYLMSKSKGLRSEFIIPLLFRELTPRTELTGAEGESLKIQIIEDDKMTE